MNQVDTLQKTNKLLKAVSYFSDLDADSLNLVTQSAIRRTYDAGRVVLLEGEPCAGLYLVESGWLKAVKIGVDGREQVLQTLGPGEVFNAIGVFTDAPNQATVTALETSQILIIQREILLSMIDKYPALARLVVKDLAGRVMYLVRMVEDMTLRPVEARLAKLLLDQLDGDIVLRQRWATQAELAARLGTVPDVFNRALRKLADAGLIHVERHQIKVLDKRGLGVIAQIIE